MDYKIAARESDILCKTRSEVEPLADILCKARSEVESP